MEPHPSQSSPRDGAPPRPQGACESCRAVKLKCLPEPGGGACRRCAEFKRECVYRTGPRTRVSRAARMNKEKPTPRSQQQTFSIDFQMPADDPSTSAFDDLVHDHAGYIDTFLPSPSPLDVPLPTPPSSISSAAPSQTRTVQSLCQQPQFNLQSATSLLHEFRNMLPYFPCIVLGEDETVQSLSRERPFVLLAILATVSGSRTVQGHKLYDEEFRKVLALKVVAGGERSLELAQGLFIYCGWFPFHLRPKHKRAYQYLRMAVDMIRDLELDRSPSGLDTPAEVTLDRVEGIRTYLSCYYLLTTFTSIWRKLNGPNGNIETTRWTSVCWSVLPTVSPHAQDATLAQLSRHAYIIREASSANRKRRDSGDQLRLVMLGLEAQLREWKLQVPEDVARSTPVVLGQTFAEIFVYCAALLKFPAQEAFTDTLEPELERVLLAVPLLRRYFKESTKLDLKGLSAQGWGRLVVCVILAMRLSFPIKALPGWDCDAARAQLGLGDFLNAVSNSAEEQSSEDSHTANRMMDIGRASSVIFNVVRKKYYDRLEREMRPTCPMLDGSLDEYLQTWEDGPGGSFGLVQPGGIFMDAGNRVTPEALAGGWGGALVGEDEALGQEAYNDLWATMTTSWADKDAHAPSPRF